MCRVMFKSGLHTLRESKGWETLSLQEALAILDWKGELTCIEHFICILQKCRKGKNQAYAKRVHEHIHNYGLETHKAVGNHIVPMLVECGSLLDAQLVFNKLIHRKEHSWTSLMLGYMQCGQAQHALNLYQKMQNDGIDPSRYTLMTLLKACASLKDLERGQMIHVEIVLRGFEEEISVGSSLIDMYAKCGFLAEAQDVFDRLPAQGIVSWTALIAGYSEHGFGHVVLKCFAQMQVEAISPNAVTLLCILKACGNMGAIEQGREIHMHIKKMGFERELFVGSTLVDMYAKSGALSDAREVLDKLPVRNVVPWNAIIGGYAEYGPGHEALKCFEQMQLEDISPDAVTYVGILKACGRIGAIDKGREIHEEILKRELERNVFVGSILIDMYAQCSSLSEAREAFDKLPVRNVVSWSAMIKGYCMNHEGNMAIRCFEDMQEQGVNPDAITFTSLLTACSHTNLVAKGRAYFKLMTNEYGIAPTIDHYTCMVELLARSGQLCEAENFLATMEYPLAEGIWRALLSSCKTYGEAELGLTCFQQLVKMNPESAASYMLMADIYMSAGRWEDAHAIEGSRKQAGAKKKLAIAVIEVNRKVHEFVVGDSQCEEISSVLECLSLRMKNEGYAPSLDLVLRLSTCEQKEVSCDHTEKLDTAFGSGYKFEIIQ